MTDFRSAIPVAATLPEFDPPAHLWSRIEQRHRQRRRLRWLRRSGAGIAAAVLLVVGMLQWASSPRSVDDALSVQRREALQLEQSWRLMARDDAMHGYARLHTVDAALQQAYDRHAGADELRTLWSERAQLLRDLIRDHEGSSPIAI